jgi:hypothetical protein
MALLGRPWALLGIEDVEAFTARIVERSPVELSYHERESLHSFLISETWRLSLSYKPGIIRQGFSTWARIKLHQRSIDWTRKEFGRTRWQFAGSSYERERPSLVPLDDAGVVDALPAGAGDPALDSPSDLGGVLGAGDRQEARDYRALGLRPPRGTT